MVVEYNAKWSEAQYNDEEVSEAVCENCLKRGELSKDSVRKNFTERFIFVGLQGSTAEKDSRTCSGNGTVTEANQLFYSSTQEREPHDAKFPNPHSIYYGSSSVDSVICVDDMHLNAQMCKHGNIVI